MYTIDLSKLAIIFLDCVFFMVILNLVLRLINNRSFPDATRTILKVLSYLIVVLPAVASMSAVLATGQPPASSVLIQRLIVGPVARTTSTALSTQTGEYYSNLNGVGCSYHDPSILATAPTGSYVVLDQRNVTQWVFFPFTTTSPVREQCTTGFHR